MDIKAKIVCTVGPACADTETLRQMIAAGMRVARLNLSHGDHQTHAAYLAAVRQASSETCCSVAVLADLQGPRLRVGNLPGPLELRAGEEVWIANEAQEAGEIPIDLPRLAEQVEPGHRLLLDEGLIALEVVRKEAGRVLCKVIDGGVLLAHKGVNVPDVALDLPAVTSKDRSDLEFILSREVDYLGLSFVRSANDIRHLRALTKQLGREDMPIVAKLEKPQALDCLDEILEEADGVMVARGDLGVELPLERVPVVQKEIIARANRVAVPVITATQMLESMIHESRPTRAETSDVANAIFDGTDAVMLSGETAVGAHPVEAVRVMASIVAEAERAVEKRGAWQPGKMESPFDYANAVGHCACLAATDLGARAIVAFTRSGLTARLISKYHPPLPIIALSPDLRTCRRLPLLWGVTPIRTEAIADTDGMLRQVDDVLLDSGLVARGDVVIVTAGLPSVARQPTNMMKVHRVGESESWQQA